MIHTGVDEIEEKLEAHEADLDTLEISNQAATAFAARANPNIARSPINHQSTPPSNFSLNSPGGTAQRPRFICGNCGRQGHLTSQCYVPGGLMEGHAPWNNQNTTGNVKLPNRPTGNRDASTNSTMGNANINPVGLSVNASNTSARLAECKSGDIVMMAHIEDEEPEILQSKVTVSTNTSAFSSGEMQSHLWFVDSAVSSHICGDMNLFQSLYVVPPIIIETASGESFTSNQRGNIRIKIKSDDLDDVSVTLLEVVYVPKLKVNLLSVGRITSANIDVSFSKMHSTLSMDGALITQGSKINNLFAFQAISSTEVTETAHHASETSTASLWHHRLAHTSYSTLGKMARMKTALGLPANINFEQSTQCVDCPYGKQTRTPFRKVEGIPQNIGDIIASDLCGPFYTSIGGYKYFVTWIDLKT